MAISQTKARLAGLFYLGTIVAGLYAEVAVRASVRVRGDAAATVANIARDPGFYRTGEAADLVMLACYLAVTVLLYEMFADCDRTLSRMAAAFSLTGIVVLASAGVLHVAPLALLEQSYGMAPVERDVLARLALDLHGDAYGISLVFFGLYCVLIGWLAIRSGLLPWWVGALMAFGGACHVLDQFGAFAAPGLAAMLPAFLGKAPLVGEAALALWLLAFGVRRAGPASTPAMARPVSDQPVR